MGFLWLYTFLEIMKMSTFYVGALMIITTVLANGFLKIIRKKGIIQLNKHD